METQIEDDFSPERIARSGQCFRWRKTKRGDWRIIHRDQCLTLRELGGGRYRFSCTEEAYRTVWRPYFDFDEDYRAIRARVREAEDPFLHAACTYGRGIRILRQDPWETLVSFIISQNKNIPAIQNCIELLCAAAGERGTDSGGEAYTAFPSPEAILRLGEAELRECRLGYRWKYVRSAALAVAERRLDLEGLAEAGEEETITRLCSLHGVGLKVASCASLFGLHHLDAFPVDVWMKRILANEYPDGYRKENYQPYNGVYQQYMFFYYRDCGGPA
ncbi:MAG: DNA-3-methyladenine glycosylase 2 family protein [Oscillospiraceae bacterium]|nr:DNA-3-methyladenine glycosylase 2 family protein [Oscillospiraceae bacterium]